MVVAQRGFSLYMDFPSSILGTWFMSNRRIWKSMSLICRHEEFVTKLLPKLRGTWRVLLVALMSAGKVGI